MSSAKIGIFEICPKEIGLFQVRTSKGGTVQVRSLKDSSLQMRLTEIVPGELFTDEMDGGDFTVRTVHRLELEAGGRTRIIYRTEITGPAANEMGPQLGPAITADFPEVLAALAKLAEG